MIDMCCPGTAISRAKKHDEIVAKGIEGGKKKKKKKQKRKHEEEEEEEEEEGRKEEKVVLMARVSERETQGTDRSHRVSNPPHSSFHRKSRHILCTLETQVESQAGFRARLSPGGAVAVLYGLDPSITGRVNLAYEWDRPPTADGKRETGGGTGTVNY